MTTWNYRMVREDVTPPGLPDPEPVYSIIEAYYPDNEPDRITMWSMVDEARGDTPADLRYNLERMIEATTLPVVEATDLPAYDPRRGLTGTDDRPVHVPDDPGGIVLQDSSGG